MSDWQDKLAVTAWRNRQEIVNAKLTRREMVKMGLLTAGGALVAKAGLSARAAHAADLTSSISLTTPVTIPPSPSHRPWVQSLPRLHVKQPEYSLSPPPDGMALVDGGTRKVPHQAWTAHPPRKFYELKVKEFGHKFHPDWNNSTMWGFDSMFPGPQLNARYGEPVLVRYRNELPATDEHVGFGIPEITTHLHNAHTPTESDGNPADFFGSTPNGVHEGFRDQHYPNMFAGNDPREALSSLWYHDHHVDFTAQNVYKGLVGFYCLYDDKDSDNEYTGLRLPAGEYDIPMMFGDVLFDQDYQPYFDLFNTDGILGDKFAVNGAIQPYCEVKRRRYRLRLLNFGPSRWYEFALYDGRSFVPFWQVSNDGNLLPKAIKRTSLRLSVAERADIIVDFSKFSGNRLYLVNRLEQLNGRGPTGRVLFPGTPLIQFDVRGTYGVPVPDGSRDPNSGGAYMLRELPDPDFNQLMTLASTARKRTWRFERGNGAWTVNGKFFDPATISANPAMDESEVWILQNIDDSWRHPIHIHFEEHRILSRNGVAPAADEMGRKDVAALNGPEEIKLFMRFRDFRGRYVMHCHNVVHEDHSMMVRWDIV